MRLDHLLSKETSDVLRCIGNILVSWWLTRVTLFNLEGTGLQKREEVGDIAQLGERLPCKQEVAGSIPTISTRTKYRPPSPDRDKAQRSGFGSKRRSNGVSKLS